jgi:hypothetical protein
MDVKYSGLLAELFAMNVIDQRDKEELDSIESSTSRIERLLSMLSKTSADQWEQFLVALDTTGQRRLANLIRGKQTEDLPGFVIICLLVHYRSHIHYRSPIVSSTIDLQHYTALAHTPSPQSVGQRHPITLYYS